MLPWGAMMRAALSAGVSVDAFWRLSLREWLWLTTGRQSGLTRAALETLMVGDPDKERVDE